MTDETGAAENRQPATSTASSISDDQRVTITVTCGIVGVVGFVAGTVLDIWSYAAGGFDLKDWKFWLGYGAMIASIFVFSWLLQWNRDLDRVNPAIRRTLYGYNIFLGTVFLAALLVLGNIFVTQYGHLIGVKPSYDWTSQGVFTLTDVSVQQVKGLTKPVKVIALYPQTSGLRLQLEQLFQLYQAANKDFTVEFVDVNQDPIKAEELFKKYPEAATREPSLIITYGSGDEPAKKVVKHSEIFKVDLREIDLEMGRGGGDTAFHGENAVTSALRALVEDKKTNVYFTSGHGELDLSVSDDRGEDALRGAGQIKQRMTELGIKAEPLDLLKSEVPGDASVLVIAGPKAEFQSAEIQKIRDYMDRRDSANARSARLLVLFDSPVEMNRGAPHDAGLGELLATYKVSVKDNVVFDRASAIGRPEQIMVHLDSEGATHPVVAPFKNQRALMMLAREVTPLSDAPPGGPGDLGGRFQTTKLFSTSESPYSWAQADYSSNARISPNAPGNTPGPVCLGVAVSESSGPPPMPPHFGAPPPPQKSTPIVIVFGDATFASNYVLSSRYGREDLFLNAVNWLGGRIADIGIQPKAKKYQRLNLDDAGYYTVIFEPFFHLVAIAGFTAGLVWVVRADRFQLLWLPISGTLVLVVIWAGLTRWLIGSFASDAARVTVMRLLMTCLLLWAIGISFWFAKMRPARPAESA